MSWRRLEAHCACAACLRAEESVGRRMAIRTAMMAITTRSSMRVKAFRLVMISSAKGKCETGKREDDRRLGNGRGESGGSMDDGDGIDIRAADAGTGGIVNRRAFAIRDAAVADDVHDAQVADVVKIDDAACHQRVLPDPVQIERVAAGL